MRIAELGLTPAFQAGFAWAGTYRTNRLMHVLVNEDFKAGRVIRKKGEALCGTSAALNPQGDTRHITCSRCIALAHTISKYNLPKGGAA